MVLCWTEEAKKLMSLRALPTATPQASGSHHMSIGSLEGPEVEAVGSEENRARFQVMEMIKNGLNVRIQT